MTVDECAKPVVQTPRRIPVAFRKRFKEALDELEKDGIIENVEQSTDWTSNVVIIEKKDNKLRICIDPSEFNRALKIEKYQIPTVEEILPEITKAKVFSTFDARSGFWQLPLDEKSKLLTSFWSPQGRYCWKRLPFGIAPALEIFQKTQHEIIVELKGVEVIADDFLVYGEGVDFNEALLKRLEEVEML